MKKMTLDQYTVINGDIFNASYTDCNTDYSNSGVDQLPNVINSLKDPSQRSS